MKQYRYALIILLLGIVVGAWWYNHNSHLLKVTFFDIGQGDATLIQTPTHQAILIDGGPDRTVMNKLGRALPWTKRKIDFIVLTHPHADHLVGLISVLERYQVGRIMMSGVLHTTPEYAKFLELIKNKNIPVTIARTGQIVRFDAGVEFKTIWPEASFVGLRVDNVHVASVVNQLRFGESTALFTGDMEMANEFAILNAGLNIKSQILKVGHHGSHTSSSEEFIKAVAPEYAIISVGKNNRYGHPHPEVLARLKSLVLQVLRTDEEGDIELVSDGKKWTRY